LSINPFELYNIIKDRYYDYLKSVIKIKDPELIKSFNDGIGKFELIKGPYLEATLEFKEGIMLDELIDQGYLSRSFRDFIFDVYPYFKKTALYYHQELAIKKAINNRNIIITTGTSSGKTECYLIPIINQLLIENEKGTINNEVRALIIYPMNALANDQIRRLRSIISKINEKRPDINITFGRYIGETKEDEINARERYRLENNGFDPPRGELISRSQMRKTPPHILITNYSMLEYLLLRPQDFPLFSNTSENSWKYLILDEIHTYIGFKCIEIGMLIRRLKERLFRNKSHQFQCFGTSATLINQQKGCSELINFANTLFDEKFEWDDKNPDCQDIIFATYKDINLEKGNSYSIDFKTINLFNEIRKDSNLVDNEKKKKIIEICKNIPNFNLNYNLNDLNINEILYHILNKDEKVNLIKSRLKESPISINELYNLFQNIGQQNNLQKNLLNILELMAFASLGEYSKPLLPVRFHIFIRPPEGLFASFYPKKELFFKRIKYLSNDKIPIFEIGFCKFCGKEYIMGEMKDGKINPLETNYLETQNQIESTYEEPKPQNYFLIMDKELEEVENEDEIIEIKENQKGNIKKYNFCIKCGSYWNNEKYKCNCDIDKQYFIYEIPTNDNKLYKCYYCLKTSPYNLIETFYFNKDELNSISLSEIYQYISRNNEKDKKILCFSDNRQDAAFFASYLDINYERILKKAFIYSALMDNKDFEDFRLQDLHDKLYKLMSEKYFSPEKSSRERREECWIILLTEFFGPKKGYSLEDLNLLKFEFIFPNNWKPSEELLKELRNFNDNEIKIIYRFIFDNFRHLLAVHFPEGAPNSEDERFSELYNNRAVYYKLKLDKSSKELKSFIPIKNTNTIYDYIQKILKSKGIETNNGRINKILETIWYDLTKNFSNNGIVLTSVKNKGVGLQISSNFWLVKPVDLKEFYECDKCGYLTLYNVNQVCPQFNCNGKLHKIDENRIRTIESNYFYKVIKKFSLVPMKVQEHTAMLEKTYATEIQQDFIKGKINVLSCSTTFELGVDLGELEIIYLKNIPPEPSNYIQRTGRAGRRKNTIGFAVTYSLLQSHDMGYFNNPVNMIAGKIEIPIANLNNVKIVSRHLRSFIISNFFMKYKDKYGTVEKFYDLDNESNSLKLFERYIRENAKTLTESLERIIPKNLHHQLKINNKFDWINDIFSSHEPLIKSKEEIFSDYNELKEYLESLTNEMRLYIQDIDYTKKINRNRDWAQKRINTIKNRDIIEYLASRSIIPKYGFPVDTVELEILSSDSEAQKVRLERDLKIAISEFAPSSQIVSNKNIFESYAIKKLRNKTWEKFFYAICPQCKNFVLSNTQLLSNQNILECKGCGIKIDKRIKTAIVPEFGFQTMALDKIKKCGENRPRKEFGSRPYFASFGNLIDKPVIYIPPDSNIKFNINYMKYGKMYVVCEGKDSGFYICENCGRGFSYRPKNTEHKNPYGYDCKDGIFNGPISLGHYFQTDILEIKIEFLSSDNSILSSSEENYSRCVSILYSLIEGATKVLGIQRSELEGSIFYHENKYELIIYETVPGGAGYMAKFIELENFKEILKTAYDIVKKCTCGLDSSCSSCLRSYSNQFVHRYLNRNLAIKFFESFKL